MLRDRLAVRRRARWLLAAALAAAALWLAGNGQSGAAIVVGAGAAVLAFGRVVTPMLAGLDPRRMLALIENLSEGVLFVDRDGRTRVANPAARRLLPEGTDDLSDLRPLRELLARCREHPMLPPLTMEQVLGDRLVVSTYVPLYTDGRFDGLLWLLRETPRSRELEAQAVQRAKLAELGLLAAGIVHEISNPLSSISAVTQMARRRGQWGEHDIDLVHGQVERLTRLVMDLKDFCRSPVRRRAPVEVNRILEDAVRLAQLDRRWKRHKIELNLCVPSPVARACPEQLQQVFLNILLNAADAMEEPGTVQIETSCRDEAVLIAFADTGPGVPPEVRARLFEPFFTTKPPGRGTGLGLSISSAIVADHGGAIELSSRPGHGAVFTVRLPAEKTHVGTNSDRR